MSFHARQPEAAVECGGYITDENMISTEKLLFSRRTFITILVMQSKMLPKGEKKKMFP